MISIVLHFLKILNKICVKMQPQNNLQEKHQMFKATNLRQLKRNLPKR
jgi:hypothetical protein